MSRQKIPAVFVRGGTSKGLFFHERDLPKDRAERDRVILQALGSPDPYQRQLNGMGGGLSSLSKAVIVELSDHPDADIDYTFAQVAVDRPIVDYAGTCGNLSASVAPFAIDEGLIEVPDGETTVRVHITNTNKFYDAHVTVRDGRAVEKGDYVMSGVSGSGALITLDYRDPGGAMTGALLPTGRPRDKVYVDGLGEIEVSLVDATNPVVFVDAAALYHEATESPETLEADPLFMARMDEIRRKGAVMMGLANRPEDVALAAPKISIVGSSAVFEAIDGRSYEPDEMDLSVRVISMERLHRAVPGTNGMCIAAAARVTGTIPHGFATQGSPLRIATPSGVLPVEADVAQQDDGEWVARSVTVFRTQRRLMEGSVLVEEPPPVRIG